MMTVYAHNHTVSFLTFVMRNREKPLGSFVIALAARLSWFAHSDVGKNRMK